MAGRGDSAHGSDRASKIMKWDGLPGVGKPIIEEPKPESKIPVIGSFVSTLGGSVELNPVLAATQFGDSIERPKFTAKITLFDSHSDDNF